jgi:DNA-binding SARP family transcriptional activator
MPSLELKLLGGFRARLSSGELLAIPSRKGQLLLAFLALRPGEALAREKLIGLLWSDRADSQARGSLRQELTTLRKVLSMVEPQPIVIGNESLQLEAGTVDVDVLEFQKLIRSDNPADLEQAVAMYTGPFLGEFLVKDPACAEWLAQERERLAGLATIRCGDCWCIGRTRGRSTRPWHWPN